MKDRGFRSRRQLSRHLLATIRNSSSGDSRRFRIDCKQRKGMLRQEKNYGKLRLDEKVGDGMTTKSAIKNTKPYTVKSWVTQGGMSDLDNKKDVNATSKIVVTEEQRLIGVLHMDVCAANSSKDMSEEDWLGFERDHSLAFVRKSLRLARTTCKAHRNTN